MAGDTETRLGSALRDVDKAIEVAASMLDFVADRELLDEAVFEFAATKNKVDALHTKLVATAKRAGIHFGSRIPTMPAYVAAHSSINPADLRRALHLGEWLRDFDVFAAAFDEGRLSAAHLAYVRNRLDTADTRADLRNDQQLLVDTAADLTFADFKKAADYWLVLRDPDGKEPQDQLDRACLSLTKGRGGRLLVKGQTDAVSGQAIQTAVDIETEKLFRDDKERGIDRTHTQRRMAALHNLVVRGAARPDGTYPTPLVNLVMSQAVAEWLLTQTATDQPADHVPVSWNDVDGRCELIDGTPIHPALALATFGVATLRRYILDADSRVIDISVNARSFPEWMKQGLHVQSRGSCDTHGCDAPFAWLQADHVQPHSHGGPTRFANGQNQCSPDNHAKSDTPHLPAWRDIRPPPHRPRREATPNDDPGDPDH